jgi:hypothetical protein
MVSKVKRKEGEQKNNNIDRANTSKNSQAQGCELLTDLSLSFYFPKLGHLKSLTTFGFIFELFDGFKLYTSQKGDGSEAKRY